MAFSIRYLVPYQVDFLATDAGSGKRITNRLYWVCNTQTTAPPAYGQPILGPSSTTTLLTALRTLWIGTVCTRMNANYLFNQAVMKAIIGKRYGSPFLPLTAVTTGAPVVVETTLPHGLLTGDLVFIQGVTAPAIINGTWVITVISPTTFSLNGSTTPFAWTGDGSVQQVTGGFEFLYADLEQTGVGSVAGSIAGDALPLYVSSSVRRLNPGIGKHFRSRFSLSPMSESDSLDGGFTVVQKPLMATALNNLLVQQLNGGTDATSGLMLACVVSKQLAFTQITPFATSATWIAPVSQFVQQRNTGSIVRRKPRLTSIIV